MKDNLINDYNESHLEDKFKLSDIPGNSQFESDLDDDIKVEICGIGCYDSTWDMPKCCFFFPYEMGIRILIVFLMF